MATEELVQNLKQTSWAVAQGRITALTEDVIEADGPDVPLGQLCEVGLPDAPILAQVIAVQREHVLLSPMRKGESLQLGYPVRATVQGRQLRVGPELAGRAVDGLGQAIDGRPSPRPSFAMPVGGRAVSPFERRAPDQFLETGVRVLDGLLPIGIGQRVGIFAASGVGKSSLLTQVATQARADRLVVCLVGERGREVGALWHRLRKAAAPDKVTLVAATSDESAALRSRAMLLALAAAEYWRDRGEHVLLLVDSVTRYAMALRELGLAAGAPPTARAYTPNIYAALPLMVERCGALASGGAITGLFTILSETDEIDDPIAELMKSLLDGHLLLSRSIAEQGLYPAVDVARSISREAGSRVAPEQMRMIQAAVSALGLYADARIMIETGAYRKGSNVALDRAIAQREALQAFCRQEQDLREPAAEMLTKLRAAVGGQHG